MTLRYLVAPAAILCITGAGFLFHLADGLPTDGTAGASRTGYGGEDYAIFLDKFKIPADDPRYEVISLQAESASYFFLINDSRKGGFSLSENMSAAVEGSPLLVIPYNDEDEVYSAHVGEMKRYLEGLGYVVKTAPYTPIMFRSLVHSGHFDAVLLGRRALS